MTRRLPILITSTILALLAGAAAPPAAAETTGVPPWTLQALDSTRDVGAHLAVGVDPNSGRTFAVYYDSADADLWVAYSVSSGGNCGTSGNWHCQLLDYVGDVGTYPSLHVRSTGIASELFVAYHDATNHALKYAKLTFNPPGLLTGSPVTVDTGSGTFEWRGTHTSIAVDAAGVPHVAYRLKSLTGAEALRLARYVGVGTGNCGPSNLWQCTSVSTGEGIGLDTSIALDGSGHPFIASYDGTTGHPVVSSSLVPGLWSHDEITRGFDDTGRSVSLVVDGSVPSVAYFNADSQKLEYAYPVGSGSGNCGTDNGWQCTVIDDMPADPGGRSVSLVVEGSGFPAIAYQGFSAELRLARPAASVSGVVPNCGPQVELARTWYCETLDAGTILTNEAAAVSMDTGGDGRPRIAYHHLYFGGSPAVGSLKLAVEDLEIFADGFESGGVTGWSPQNP